jgi:hypothetical protein
VLQGAARECMELVERDRSAFADRVGMAFVLALRPWVYSGFTPFRTASATATASSAAS